MGDDDVAECLKEKTARKATVLEQLKLPKLRLLEAIEKCDQPKTQQILIKKLEKILGEEYAFNLSRYLHCTKMIYLAFGNSNQNREINRGTIECFTYVLRHARLFGDQTQNMFQHLPNLKKTQEEIRVSNEQLPDTKYMSKIAALISDLKNTYNQTKYNILNANVTYLTLLVLQRHVRDDNWFNDENTNKDYVTFCPGFVTELPINGKQFHRHLKTTHLKELAYLAILAHVTVKDDLSKTILQKTCIQYLEWHDSLLPSLFFKTINLYNLEIGMLWDLLSSDKTFVSLFRIADVFIRTNNLTRELIPFHKVLELPISCSSLILTGSQNVYLCTVLAYIIDLKIGNNKSFIRKSNWANDDAAKKAGMKIAKAFYQFYEK